MILRHQFQKSKRSLERRKRRGRSAHGPGPVLSETKVRHEVSDRVRAISAGALPIVLDVAIKSGLPSFINDGVNLLQRKRPYYESDHILTIALNVLGGGEVLDDVTELRNDEVMLDALGVVMLPAPTTLGTSVGDSTPHLWLRCRKHSIRHV